MNFSDEFKSSGDDTRLVAVIDVQLAEDALNLCPNGVDRNDQFVCNLAIGVARRQKP